MKPINRAAAPRGQSVPAAGSMDNSHARRNIMAVLDMEQAAMDSRSGAESAADAIARHAGRPWFITAHGIWFIAWILINSGPPGIRAFDPFPYQFLTFVVSLESIFLSLFILMSQNRSSRQTDARSHLDLQINLLAEQESTKMLQMLHSLCKHHNLEAANDVEVESLKAPIEPAALVKELDARLPDQS